MDGREFLEAAKSLAKSQSEAFLRSAISRAYYALLNVASQFLIRLGFVVQRGPAKHGQVYAWLFNCGVDKMVDFARLLDELRTRRNEADYDMDSKEFQNNVICSLRVAKAELALKLLAECDKTSLRQQIQNGIREYERKIKS